MSDRTSTPARRARRRRTRRVAVAGVAVALVAVGGVGYASTRGPAERYRTAPAEEASVAQTVTGTGTVASAARADVAFQVAGTVATVDVSVGDTVAAGDVLATLDPESLQEALEQAESALADAEQELEDDLASQTATSTATSGTTGTGTTTGTTTGASGAPGGTSGTPSGSESPAVTAAVAAVTRAQQDLLAQAEAASAALATARTSLAAGRTSCGESVDPSTPTPTPTLPTEPTTEPAVLAACRAALDQALTDQDAVETAQSRLGELARALDAVVSEARRALTSAGGSSSGGSDSSGSSTGTQTAAGTPSGTSDTAEAASAEDLLADQAAIELARARVVVAQAELGMAAMTSPIAGRVGAVALVAGDQVGAASDTAVVTVLGDGGHVIELTVGLAVVDTVEAGQSAQVTVASTDEVLTGTVSSVGVLDVSDSGEPEYAVVVTLDATDAPLFDGAAAQVTITVGTGDATLTVPTSAVHTTDGVTTVTVLPDGGEPVDVEVEVGAVGAERTEIVSGLSTGDVVVLADLTLPVTQDDEASTGSGLTGLTDTEETSLPQGPMGGGPGMPPGSMTGQG